MLSICIPIYNQHVKPLVTTLHKQAATLNAPVSIELLDDGSDEAYRQQNRSLQNLPLVRYEEMPSNLGRSRIRNLLAEKASHPYLLFLDCDTGVDDEGFLNTYTSLLKHSKVICGGHRYGACPDDPKLHLHWKVGSFREAKRAKTRQKKPYRSFMTANFLIEREVFLDIRFREEIQGYGHEDTLFGYDLKKRRLKILHIDNPVLHLGLEPAGLFLKKTEEGLENLLKTYALVQKDPVYVRMVKALQTYVSLKKWKISFIPGKLIGLLRIKMEKQLLGRHPKLSALDLYKLCTLYRIEQQKG